jgi:hypothetical protein
MNSKQILCEEYAFRAVPIIIISTFSIFISLFLYFKITAPEGCSASHHYFLGNGDPLELKSDYFPKSPVIVKALKGIGVGEVEKVTFEQNKI